MKTKRLLVKRFQSQGTITEYFYKLSQIIEFSQSLEQFDSALYVIKIDDTSLYCALSVIGFENNLFEDVSILDIEYCSKEVSELSYEQISSEIESLTGGIFLEITSDYARIVKRSFQKMTD